MTEQDFPTSETNAGPEISPTPPSQEERVALVPSRSAPLVESSSGSTKIPWYIGPLMWTHFAVSFDLSQHRQWKERVEGVQMLDALERVRGHETRSLVRRPEVWRRIQFVSAAGANVNLLASTSWLVWLVPLYALGHGFGWFAAMAFLLPIPIAWKVSRRLYQGAAIESIRDANRSSTVRRWVGSAARTFGAGFGFGFTLLFLQGLISWFMTPAPSLAMELFLDGFYALIAGTVSGTTSLLLAPLIAHTGRAALSAAPDTTRQLGA